MSLSLLILAIAGCGGDNAEGQRDTSSQREIYTVADPTGDWGFPGPFGHYDRGPGYIRMSLIFDTLVWKDAGGFVPALAENWSFDRENNTFIFHLRPNVTWHDGEKFTARDVVFTFAYFKAHPYSLVDVSPVAAVEADGEYAVRVKLEKPYAPFLDNVAGTLPILPAHIWRDVRDPGTFTGEKALVGSGPFKLSDYNREHGTYLYEANENYYNGRPLVKQLRFVRVSEEMAMAALQKGAVNAAEIKPETVDGMKKAGFTVISGPCFWNAKLVINHHKEPLDSRAFRQALAYAVDREELVRVVARGHAVAASPGMLPPDSRWHNSGVPQYGHNPQKAGEILAGLGYTLKNGVSEKEGRPLKLELMVSQRFARDGEIIAAQLAAAGIQVELLSLEAKTLDSRVEKWEFDLALSGHGGLGGDPVILNRVIAGPGFNSARYAASGELNELLHEQLGETDPEARKQLVDRIQAIYAREVPALSLYYPRWYFGHDGSVNLFYTADGIGAGVPLPLNKMAFVKK